MNGGLGRTCYSQFLDPHFFSFFSVHLVFGSFTIPYDTLRYFSGKGKSSLTSFPRASLSRTLGLRPYVDQCTFKTKINKLRSGLHLTHYPTGIGAGFSTVCKRCHIEMIVRRYMRNLQRCLFFEFVLQSEPVLRGFSTLLLLTLQRTTTLPTDQMHTTRWLSSEFNSPLLITWALWAKPMKYPIRTPLLNGQAFNATIRYMR